MLRTFKDDKEFYASLPKKRIGAGVLLFYKQDLLIVQPTYNPGWILPGGTVQGEESPLEGLHREVREELSIPIEPRDLISVDYISNKDIKGEYIQFLFTAEELSEVQAQRIRLDPYELRDFKFVDIDKALTLLIPSVAKRVGHSLIALEEKKGAIYLENGSPLTPTAYRDQTDCDEEAK
ncbi:NUDIX hydrolase [Bdellovibrio sp. ArHS]|uniref:NUDIX domain-containing protein n=1 Tax=Bdellovibrio sp. ArHS TaxID=1569284 RepID=UPI000AF5397D|nr:NUDIX hydrolase [Bdellovibrio sp. ArHS]